MLIIHAHNIVTGTILRAPDCCKSDLAVLHVRTPEVFHGSLQ